MLLIFFQFIQADKFWSSTEFWKCFWNSYIQICCPIVKWKLYNIFWLNSSLFILLFTSTTIWVREGERPTPWYAQEVRGAALARGSRGWLEREEGLGRGPHAQSAGEQYARHSWPNWPECGCCRRWSSAGALVERSQCQPEPR